MGQVSVLFKKEETTLGVHKSRLRQRLRRIGAYEEIGEVELSRQQKEVPDIS